jgi:hypothetical protein
MKVLPISVVVAAATVAGALPLGNNLNAKPSASIEAQLSSAKQRIGPSGTTAGQSFQRNFSTEKCEADIASPNEPSLQGEEQGNLQQSEADFSVRDYSRNDRAIHPYVALPAERKPAEIVLDSLKGVPIGTPLEEIKRASDIFGMDFSFMRTVAKIESDFDPKQRTGSYIGLSQLDRSEFAIYGAGDITSPRDNAIAAANKFANEARLFEQDTHKKPTFSDLYLIHQQGWQGAAQHVSQPDRIAWKSICATAEGRQKGEKWCKRAIWENTLPIIKRIWKSVDKLTSGAFVGMWRERVDRLYARYSENALGSSDD